MVGKVILKWKLMRGFGLDSSSMEQRLVTGCCVHRKEHVSLIKVEKT
jgi:hypothetical protein